MIFTFDRARPKPRPAAQAPSIREACLVGDPARRYVHIDLGEPGQGSPRRDGAVEAGRRVHPRPNF